MELVKVENPMDVYVVASRPQAQRAVLKFARSTSCFLCSFLHLYELAQDVISCVKDMLGVPPLLAVSPLEPSPTRSRQLSGSQGCFLSVTPGIIVGKYLDYSCFLSIAFDS